MGVRVEIPSAQGSSRRGAGMAGYRQNSGTEDATNVVVDEVGGTRLTGFSTPPGEPRMNSLVTCPETG